MMFTIACSQAKKDDPTPVQVRGDNADVRGGSGNFGLSGYGAGQLGMLSGRILAENGQEVQFEQAIKGFLSATVSPDQVGEIGYGDVMFQGQIYFDASGNALPQKQVQLNGASQLMNSGIRIEITDSYTDDVDEQGNYIEPLSVQIPLKSGYAKGGQVQLIFEDQYGVLEMTGRYSSPTSNFEGLVKATNKTAVQGTSPFVGHLGKFSIPVCQFFSCQ